MEQCYSQYKKPLAIAAISLPLATAIIYTICVATRHPEASAQGLSEVWNWLVANPVLALGFLALLLVFLAKKAHEHYALLNLDLEAVEDQHTYLKIVGVIACSGILYLGNFTYYHRDSAFIAQHGELLATVAGVILGSCLLCLLLHRYYDECMRCLGVEDFDLGPDDELQQENAGGSQNEVYYPR